MTSRSFTTAKQAEVDDLAFIRAEHRVAPSALPATEADHEWSVTADACLQDRVSGQALAQKVLESGNPSEEIVCSIHETDGNRSSTISNHDLKIVPATPALVEAFFGRPSPYTFRGHAALIGGRVVGLGGVSIVNGLPIAFTDMTDELRARIKDRARCFRFLEGEFNRHAGRLFALCSEDEPTALRILARLGFKPVAGQLMVREASNA